MRVIRGAQRLGAIGELVRGETDRMSGLGALKECSLGLGGELGAGTCCEGVLNSILLNTQSINRLYWVSQLCPRTILQLESNGVT